MIHALVEVERNTSSAVEKHNLFARKDIAIIKCNWIKIKIEKEGTRLVELDQFKATLNTYTKGLIEVRDSL